MPNLNGLKESANPSNLSESSVLGAEAPGIQAGSSMNMAVAETGSLLALYLAERLWSRGEGQIGRYFLLGVLGGGGEGGTSITRGFGEDGNSFTITASNTLGGDILLDCLVDLWTLPVLPWDDRVCLVKVALGGACMLGLSCVAGFLAGCVADLGRCALVTG